MISTVPSGASFATVTVPLGSTITPVPSPSTFHVVAVLVAQPLASRTRLRNLNDSPVRRSFFEGRTSSLLGSPGVVQLTFGSGSFAVGVGVGAVGGAVGVVLLSSRTRSKL